VTASSGASPTSSIVSVVKLTVAERTPGSCRMLFSMVMAQLPQSMPAILRRRGAEPWVWFMGQHYDRQPLPGRSHAAA
jgi:hypothetical protein